MGGSATIGPAAKLRLCILLQGTTPARNLSGTGISRPVAGTDSPVEFLSCRRGYPRSGLINRLFIKPRSVRWSERAIIEVSLPTAKRLGANYVVDPILGVCRHLNRLESAAAELGQVFARQGRRRDQGPEEPGWRLILRKNKGPRR